MSVYEGYTVHLIIGKERSIIVCGDDYDAALEEYHKARQTALRECTIVDHPDGNGFWAMNREDTSKTYNVRFLKDYNQAYEHALSFYDYDAAEMYYDIDAGAPHGSTQREAIRSAVVSGAFLVYDDEIADFLESYDGHESKYADTNFNRYQDIIVSALAI